MARLVGLHAAAAFLFSLSPCDPTDSDGGTASSSGTAALDPSAQIASLTSAQKAELCDWEAARLGGYGTTTTCSTAGDSGIVVYASQAECVANFATSINTCQATVQDEYNCVNDLVTDPCLSVLNGDPACEPIVSCD